MLRKLEILWRSVLCVSEILLYDVLRESETLWNDLLRCLIIVVTLFFGILQVNYTSPRRRRSRRGSTLNSTASVPSSDLYSLVRC